MEGATSDHPPHLFITIQFTTTTKMVVELVTTLGQLSSPNVSAPYEVDQGVDQGVAIVYTLNGGFIIQDGLWCKIYPITGGD